MVSDLNRSKNLSKMKSQKLNNRSRRNKISLTKDQTVKSPKKEDRETKSDIRIKSGSWTRTTCHWDLPSTNSKPKSNVTVATDELAFPSLPDRSQPRILYSDVLFSGEKRKTPVKIKNLTPRHKITSRSRKHLISVERNPQILKKKENEIEPVETSGNNSYVPKSSIEFQKCLENLFKSLHIDIPIWNFEDFGKSNNDPDYVCRFDDYNYLACENVALVGLRLASDGKFKS